MLAVEAAVQVRHRDLGRGQEGISVIEMVVVTFLISTLIAVAIPTYFGSIRSSSLNTATNQIVSDIRKAQARSMATGIRYGYQFSAGAQTYLYIRDAGSTEVLETRQLPKRIKILDTTFTNNKLLFLRSGASSESGQLRVRYSDGTLKTISIVRITGRVSVQ